MITWHYTVIIKEQNSPIQLPGTQKLYYKVDVKTYIMYKHKVTTQAFRYSCRNLLNECFNHASLWMGNFINFQKKQSSEDFFGIKIAFKIIIYIKNYFS